MKADFSRAHALRTLALFPIALGPQGDEVEAVQNACATLDVDPGPIDGDYGDRTLRAHAVAVFRAIGHRVSLWGRDEDLGLGPARRDREHDDLEELVELLQDTGIQVFSPVVNRQWDEPGRLRYRLDGLALAAARLREVGVDFVPTVFIRDKRGAVAAQVSAIRDVLAATGVGEVILDAEEAFNTDFGSGAAVAAELVDGLRAIDVGENPLRIGVTGIPYVPPNTRAIARLCDYGIPQSYSQWGRHASRQHDVYRPGVTQKLSRDRWSPLVGQQMAHGLAVYRQRRPEVSALDAHGRAFAAAVRLRTRGVALWSSAQLDDSDELLAFYRFVTGRSSAAPFTRSGA